MTLLELARGNVVTVTAHFIDTETGALVDPDSVSASVFAPTGLTTYVLGGPDGMLMRDSLGVYHIDVAGEVAGWYRVRFKGTGAHQAAQMSEWRVKHDSFTP
jgi:hypothetical protein